MNEFNPRRVSWLQTNERRLVNASVSNYQQPSNPFEWMKSIHHSIQLVNKSANPLKWMESIHGCLATYFAKILAPTLQWFELHENGKTAFFASTYKVMCLHCNKWYHLRVSFIIIEGQCPLHFPIRSCVNLLIHFYRCITPLKACEWAPTSFTTNPAGRQLLHPTYISPSRVP